MITKECNSIEELADFFREELGLPPLVREQTDFQKLAEDFLEEEFYDLIIIRDVFPIRVGISMNHTFLVDKGGGV